jgi:hypothetical protein
MLCYVMLCFVLRHVKTNVKQNVMFDLCLFLLFFHPEDESIHFSETTVNLYQNTRCNIQEYSTLHDTV